MGVSAMGYGGAWGATGGIQGGCGLNHSGRWPEELKTSMGRDSAGHSSSEVAFGENNLRPNEYVDYDVYGKPTGTQTGPWLQSRGEGGGMVNKYGTYGNPVAEAQAKQKAIVEKEQKDTTYQNALYANPDLMALRNPQIPSVSPWASTFGNAGYDFYKVMYGNEYHTYDQRTADEQRIKAWNASLKPLDTKKIGENYVP